MIVLDIEKYCHDCPLFEAETKKIYSLDRVIETRIVCSRGDLCDMLKRHLEAEVKKEERSKPEKREGTLPCHGCRHLIGCDPLRMALNSEERPCESYEEYEDDCCRKT